MFDPRDPEDRLIRKLWIGGAGVALLGFIATAAAIAFLVSLNFNVLDWME